MYVFIINKMAGGGRAGKLFDKIKKHPLYYQEKCRSFVTEYEGHAEKLTKQLTATYSEQIKCVIVIGGDGTLHETINGLKKYPDIPVACIPAGSGNDFVRGYGINGDPIDVFKKILGVDHHKFYWPGYYSIDTERESRKKLFVNSISFGFDAEITQIANLSVYKKWLNKWKIGSLSYVIAILEALKKYKPLTIDLVVDGKRKKLENILMVTISNHPFYGGGMKINPSAQIGPNLLSILIIQGISKWKILFLFITVFFGKHVHLKEVTVIQGSSISIESKVPIYYQVDGQTGMCKVCRISKDSLPRKVKGVRSNIIS